MKFQLLILAVTLLTSSLCFGRAPAVDPVVGIEPATYIEMKEGYQFAYDFRGDPAVIRSQGAVSGNAISIVAILAFVTLPFFMWMGIQLRMRSNSQNQSTADNVSYVDFGQKAENNGEEVNEVDKAS